MIPVDKSTYQHARLLVLRAKVPLSNMDDTIQQAVIRVWQAGRAFDETKAQSRRFQQVVMEREIAYRLRQEAKRRARVPEVPLTADMEMQIDVDYRFLRRRRARSSRFTGQRPWAPEDRKAEAVAAVRAGESTKSVAARFGVSRVTIYRWAKAAEAEGR